MTTPKVKWGILGTGDIAGAYAHALARSETGELIAVGSRNKSRAEAFGETHKIWRCYGSYQGLVSDPEVQVIFIATLHPLHSEWTRRALEAGKHVLCTKPLCMNHAEARKMFGAAKKSGVLLMEAFTYRSHPQTARLVELVKSGAVGEVRIIEAGFSNAIPFNAGSRLYCKAMGGGSILDVGCYPVSMARLLAGAALGRDFADPVEIKGIACFGKTGVDEMASAILKFPGDIFAEVASGMMVGRENWVRVFGTEGEMRVPSPWIPAHNGGPTKIFLKHRG
jgi:predicted dehydrogenase